MNLSIWLCFDETCSLDSERTPLVNDSCFMTLSTWSALDFCFSRSLRSLEFLLSSWCSEKAVILLIACMLLIRWDSEESSFKFRALPLSQFTDLSISGSWSLSITPHLDFFKKLTCYSNNGLFSDEFWKLMFFLAFSSGPSLSTLVFGRLMIFGFSFYEVALLLHCLSISDAKASIRLSVTETVCWIEFACNSLC